MLNRFETDVEPLWNRCWTAWADAASFHIFIHPCHYLFTQAPAHRFAKRTILHCKTGTFALQNWHFWNAKLAVLECKTGSFRILLVGMWMAERCYPLIIRCLSNNRIAALRPCSPPPPKLKHQIPSPAMAASPLQSQHPYRFSGSHIKLGVEGYFASEHQGGIVVGDGVGSLSSPWHPSAAAGWGRAVHVLQTAGATHTTLSSSYRNNFKSVCKVTDSWWTAKNMG